MTGASTALRGTTPSPAHHLDPHPPENNAKTKPPTNQTPFAPRCMPAPPMAAGWGGAKRVQEDEDEGAGSH